MPTKTLAVIVLLCTFNYAGAQILGGGTQFSNAGLFNPSWLSGCPAAPTVLSNQPSVEPTITIDPCAPVPQCATGSPVSDVWFSFFAQSATARIMVNPSASFNIAIQAFSGNACPGLTDIGCTDAGGVGVTETLELTGLTINQLYYFRIFGSSNDVSNRTGSGTYNFCGSTQLGSSILDVFISNFTASKQPSDIQLSWTTESELGNNAFEVQRSSDGDNYNAVGKVQGAGTSAQVHHYTFNDSTYSTTGLNYYRLKAVANNGSFQYSSVVVLRPGNDVQNKVTILSNPVRDNLSIRISSDAACIVLLKVIDDLGRLICQQSNTVVKGDNLITIMNPSLYKPGKEIYTLQLHINNQILNTKFVTMK